MYILRMFRFIALNLVFCLNLAQFGSIYHSPPLYYSWQRFAFCHLINEQIKTLHFLQSSILRSLKFILSLCRKPLQCLLRNMLLLKHFSFLSYFLFSSLTFKATICTHILQRKSSIITLACTQV